MNRTEFKEEIADLYNKCMKIIEAKNDDYANSIDPFQNFRVCNMINVPVERGILVRFMDKVVRISNLLEKEATVKNESIEDTLMDAINYLGILYVWLKESKTNESSR